MVYVSQEPGAEILGFTVTCALAIPENNKNAVIAKIVSLDTLRTAFFINPFPPFIDYPQNIRNLHQCFVKMWLMHEYECSSGQPY